MYMYVCLPDVKDAELDVKEVRTARKEEVGYMENRNIWTVRPESETSKEAIKTETIFSRRRFR